MSDITTDPMARYANFHSIYNVEKLRESLAKLADLPGDMPVFLVLDDGNETDSYAPATELQITHWNRYERCSSHDEDAELVPVFIYPAEHPSGVAGEGAFHPVGNLAALRDAIAQLENLPGDTIALRTEDASNDEDSITVAHDFQVAWWNGEIQCEETDDGAKVALFII